jgi:hypothetical protein
MQSNINAVNDKWIHCVGTEGPVEASIKEIFNTGSPITGLAEGPWYGLPPLNLLVAIATAAVRPQTDSEIISYLNFKGSFCDKVQEYLAKHIDKFNMFDAKSPFLQVAFVDTSYTMPTSKTKGYTRTTTSDLALAEGQKTVAMRSPGATDPVGSLGEILRAVLRSQVIGGNKKYNASRPGGPKLLPVGQVGGFQSAVPVSLTTNGGSTSTLNIRVEDPSSLLNTIILNMVPESTVKLVFGVYGFGSPVWEYDVWDDHTKMLSKAQEMTESFLGRLIPITKFIWIDPAAPSEMIYSDASGLDYQKPLENLKAAKQHDSTYYFPSKSETGKATLGAYKEGSYLWQEFASLDVNSNTPIVLHKFRNGYSAPVICVASAMSMNKPSMGLITINNVVETKVEWPNGCLTAYINGKLKIDSLVSIASENAYGSQDKKVKGWNIGWAMRKYADVMNIESDGKVLEGLKSTVLRKYWETLSKNFPEYLVKLEGKTAEEQVQVQAEWKQLCKNVAKSHIWSIADGNPRTNKAVVIACN